MLSSRYPRFGTIEHIRGCEAYFSKAFAIKRCFSLSQFAKGFIIDIPDFPKELREYSTGGERFQKLFCELMRLIPFPLVFWMASV